MKVKALIVTLGNKGSAIYADGQRLYIQCVEAKAVIDPTGCGDAYRAGLIYGITHGWDWLTSGRLASVMAAIKMLAVADRTMHQVKQKLNLCIRKLLATISH